MAKNNLTFESFFECLNEKNDCSNTNETIGESSSERRPERESAEYAIKRKHPCIYTSTEEIETDDDESVTNPFTDSLDGSDADWNPDSEGSSDSSCCEKLSGNIGVEAEPTSSDISGLKEKGPKPKKNSDPLNSNITEEKVDTVIDDPSRKRSCELPSAAHLEDMVEDSRSSAASEVFPMLTTAEELPTVSIAKRGNLKNKWDKKHSCVFCSKRVNKMSTHLQRVHRNESSVTRVLAMAKGSSERRLAWAELLNQGDFKHNYEVLESGSGELIPKYRTKYRTVEDVVACSFCKGLYGKSLLYLHHKTCSKRADSGAKGKGQAVRQGSMLMPLPRNVSEKFFEHVVSRMQKDDITKIVLNDSLIVKFGERKFYATDVEEHTQGHISSRVRELGRLMKVIRGKTDMKVSTLSQALHPENFDLVIQSVRELAEFDEEHHHFKKGSLALRLGHSLKKCTSVLRAEAIKREDDDLVKQADRFDSLFSGDWSDYISVNAGQSIHKERFNKPKLLPACADVEKVHVLLEADMKSRHYATCTKATLCSVSLFNRKRGGEVQRLKMEDFKKGMSSGASNPETYEDLSELEKKLVSHFKRIEIRGKFCRKVPILLTPIMVESIQNIIDFRDQQQPKITSKYLFARSTGERPYRGSDVIREFAKKAEVSDPTLFTFTRLRKQVATLSQTLQISKWEQDQLATFLGHDIRVHRSIYRQPLEVLDRAKVAKILLAVNKGMTIDLECGANEHDELDYDPQEEIPPETENWDSDEGVSQERNRNDSIELQMNSKTVSSADITQTQSNSDIQRPKACQKMKRQPWSENEIRAVKRHLNHCIIACIVPRKDQVIKAVAAEPCLGSRSWRNVKDFVYNLIKKQKKP